MNPNEMEIKCLGIIIFYLMTTLKTNIEIQINKN